MTKLTKEDIDYLFWFANCFGAPLYWRDCCFNTEQHSPADWVRKQVMADEINRMVLGQRTLSEVNPSRKK